MTENAIFYFPEFFNTGKSDPNSCFFLLSQLLMAFFSTLGYASGEKTAITRWESKKHSLV